MQKTNSGEWFDAKLASYFGAGLSAGMREAQPNIVSFTLFENVRIESSRAISNGGGGGGGRERTHSSVERTLPLSGNGVEWSGP